MQTGEVGMSILLTHCKNFLSEHRRFAYLFIIAFVSFLICSSTIHDYFLADDFSHIQSHRSKSFRDLAKLFVSELKPEEGWGETALRPLQVYSFRLDYHLSGFNPVVYHLTNIILHILNSLLIFLIVTTLANGRSWTAFIAGILFALAPVHSEPICWISGGKSDSFATFFYLSAFLSFVLYRSTYLRRYHYLSIAAFALGLFTKEILLTFPLMILAYDLFFTISGKDKILSGLRRHITVYAPFFLLILFYLFLRRIVFGNFAQENSTAPPMEFLIRQANNFRHLWLPFYAYAIQDRFIVFLEAVTLSIFLLWFFFLLRSRSEYNKIIVYILYFGVVWYLISIIPLAVAGYPSLRHLYHPSCGIYIAMAFLLFPFSPKQPTKVSFARLTTTVFLAVVFGHTLVKANAEWSKAGAISQKARADIEELAETIPKGSTVIIDVPLEYNGRAMAWRYVMPYVLQEPYCSQDVYSKFQIIEPWPMYCCPIELWWVKIQRTITSLLSEQAGDNILLYELEWNNENASIALKKGRIEKEELRARIEELLQQPVEDIETIGYESYTPLMKLLKNLIEFSNTEEEQKSDGMSGSAEK